LIIIIPIFDPGALISGWNNAMSPPSQSVTSVGPEDAGANAGLAIARNLARIYTDVLEAPVPGDLQQLLRKWEDCETSKDG